MSLVCHECEVDVQPSDSLPGREGGFVCANTIALVWVEEKGQPRRWEGTFVETPARCALCFECIVNKMPVSRRHIMSAVFGAYEAETAFGRIQQAQKGKWINLAADPSGELFNTFKQKMREVPQDSCIICDVTVPSKGQAAFFTFHAFDKAACEGQPSIFGSYQWSNATVGMTEFKICFDCFRTRMPRTTSGLSSMLRGTGETSTVGSTLYISPGALQHLFGVTPN